MIRLSRFADYAVILLCEIAKKPDELVSASTLAKQAPSIGEASVVKILKLLSQAAILEAVRGAHGGYRLTKDIRTISVFDIVCAVDGPVAVTLCANSAEDTCQFEPSCMVKCGWNRVNDAIHQTLKQFTLIEFISSHEVVS